MSYLDSVSNFFNEMYDAINNTYWSIVDTYEKVNLLLDMGLGYFICSGIILIALLAVTVSTKNTVKELQKEIAALKEPQQEQTEEAPREETKVGDFKLNGKID